MRRPVAVLALVSLAACVHDQSTSPASHAPEPAAGGGLDGAMASSASVDPSVPPASSARPPGTAALPSSPAPATSSAPARCLRPLAATPPPIPPKAAVCPADTARSLPGLGHGTVHVEGVPGTTLTVEIARTDAATERGLMFRKTMAEDAGMLFLFAERMEHTFWMHNTCIPLDMLFVDTDGTIVGVEEAVPTVNDEPRTVGCFSENVLEVNAGWTRRHGVSPGQKLVTERASK